MSRTSGVVNLESSVSRAYKASFSTVFTHGPFPSSNLFDCKILRVEMDLAIKLILTILEFYKGIA